LQDRRTLWPNNSSQATVVAVGAGRPCSQLSRFTLTKQLESGWAAPAHQAQCGCDVVWVPIHESIQSSESVNEEVSLDHGDRSGHCDVSGRAVHSRTVRPTLRHPGPTPWPISGRCLRPGSDGRQPLPSQSGETQGRSSPSGRTVQGSLSGRQRGCAKSSGSHSLKSRSEESASYESDARIRACH